MAARKQTRAQVVAAAVERWRRPLVVGLGLVLAAASLAWAQHYLTQPGRLPLRVIQVNGEFRELQRGEIERTVGAAIDGGFFSCDMQKLRDAVLHMPWVADVSIRRVWPDTLKMNVTEEVPLARWGEQGLVNVNGGVFTPPTLGDYAGLIRLQGPDGSQRRLVAFLQALLPAAQARDLRVRAVELDRRRHWWVRFDGDLTLSLGREQVDERLAQFFRVYPSLAAQAARVPARVDMRYAHGFAVRWREATQQETAAAAAQDRA